MLLAAQVAPSVLFGVACVQVVVVNYQVVGSSSVVCADGCRLPRSDKASGLMREACTRDQLLGPVEQPSDMLARLMLEAGFVL